jgi:anti-sigma B factor antagonist
MGSSELTVRAVRGVAVVGLADLSETDYDQIESFKQALYNVIDRRGASKIALDFTKVTYLPTEAIGALLKLKAKAEGLGGDVVIFGLGAYPLEAFEFLHLHRVFEICDTEEQALAALGVRT